MVLIDHLNGGYVNSLPFLESFHIMVEVGNRDELFVKRFVEKKSEVDSQGRDSHNVRNIKKFLFINNKITQITSAKFTISHFHSLVDTVNIQFRQMFLSEKHGDEFPDFQNFSFTHVLYTPLAY